MSRNTVRPRGTGLFNKTASIDIQRSRFDLSHTYKTTLDGGYLVPVLCHEALPGDTWKLNYTQLCRMTTPIVPFMDNVHAQLFFFSIPKRLVWDNFEDFITGSTKGRVGTTHTAYPTVTIADTDWTPGSIYDYMGIPPPAAGNSITVNALPLRCYNLVYNEWFRDENLMSEIAMTYGDLDTGNVYALRKRGKRKDYFTAALPWPQKGPDVSLPLGSTAPVKGNGKALGLTDGTTEYGFQGGASGNNTLLYSQAAYGANVGTATTTYNSSSKAFGVTTDKDKSGLIADLSGATAATINSLREAFAVQHVLERDARGGSRYVESLLSHFSVQSPDFRLQRPEYLGGGRIEFAVNSIAQTSATQSNSPQGNLAAYAASVGNCGFVHSFVEHCYVLGLLCITTDLTYQQGLNKMWSRSTRFDEYWPEFAHLGESPILVKEIYCDGSSNDDTVFGYQERYSEYRYIPSQITGKLRSGVSGSLDVWHLAQEFASAPTLSQSFIEEDPPFARVLAVQNEPQFVLDAFFSIDAMRPLPMFGTPSLLDHF